MTCTRCQLHRTAQNVCVPSRGSEDPVILFVGEAPGKTEDQTNQTFCGKSGKELDKLMEKAGLDPAFCRWANITRCIPWKDRIGGKVRSPKEHEMDACCRYLDKEVLRTKPVFIVPLGASSAYYFLGKSKITQVRGRRHVAEVPTLRYRYNLMLYILHARGIEDMSLIVDKPSQREKAIEKAAKLYDYQDLPVSHFTVFPTFHPASTLYGGGDARRMDILADLNYLVSQIKDEDEGTNYVLLRSLDDVEKLINRLIAEYEAKQFKFLGYDVETSSLDMFDPSQLLTTLAVSSQPGNGWTVPLEHRESPFKNDRLAMEAVKGLLNKLFSVVPIVGHNVKFDYKWSYVKGIYLPKIYDDTELQAWTLFNDLSEHDLETLTSRHTNLLLHKQEMKEAMDSLPREEKYNTDNYDIELIARYNAADTDSCVRLCTVFEELMAKEGLLDAHRRITVPAIIPTAEMELNGCLIDTKFKDELDKSMSKEIEEYYARFDEWGLTEVMERLINPDEDKPKKKKFSLNSPEQVSMLLFDILDLTPVSYGKVRKNGVFKGQRVASADKKSILELMEKANEELGKLEGQEVSQDYQIWQLRFNVLKTIQDFKGVSKLYSSYVKNMPEYLDPKNIVHPTYGVRHTATGRYNCVDPALQTIPWHSVIKQMFVCRFENGVVLSADFSQMELRVFAMATGDEELMRTFNEGRDIHRMIASRGLNLPEDQVPDHERRRFKTVIFGLLYGRGPKSIAAQEGMSVNRAKRIIASVFEQFPNIRRFIVDTHAFVEKHGYVKYINGFRRVIPRNPHDDGSHKRKSVNSKIQGPASDLGVSAMINAQTSLHRVGFQSKLYQFVHDSIGYDVPPGELFDLCMVLKKEMEQRLPIQWDFINVPLRVDFELGISWGHFIELKLTEGRKVRLEGKREYFEKLMERLLCWEDAPILLDVEEEVKEEPAVIRSLLRTSGLEEMIQVPYVKADLEFPPFAFREPRYLV